MGPLSEKKSINRWGIVEKGSRQSRRTCATNGATTEKQSLRWAEGVYPSSYPPHTSLLLLQMQGIIILQDRLSRRRNVQVILNAKHGSSVINGQGQMLTFK